MAKTEKQVPRGITIQDWEYIVVALRFIENGTKNPESKRQAQELLEKLGEKVER